MTSIAAPLSAGAPAAPPRSEPAGLAIEIVPDLLAAEPAWREIEQDPAMSPYGRFDWLAAYLSEVAGAAEIRVAIARDGAGNPVLAVPLVLQRRFGLRIASAVGGKHVNYNLPPCRTDLWRSLRPDSATRLLGDIGRALRADVLAWTNVPRVWDGAPNPFAAGGSPSPSDSWSLPLEPDGEATLKRSMSADARKKLRSKLRGLDQLGPVAVLEARTEAEVDRVLDAFFRQKQARFDELGLADPFADPGMRRFLRRAALSSGPSNTPAVELYGLVVGERVVATLGGAADSRRLSGMFLSFERGEAERFSPGEILVTRVIALQCARGRAVLDLGVGDARYKRSICDRPEPLVDVVLPVTRRGRLYAAGRRAATDLKRRVKATPRAMAVIGRLRRAGALLRRSGGAA
jgi:CelD/BcsL family acetyltransferase involved in cellulose biosynthesis